MTHRMLSKNSASSRAIPVQKLIKDVEADPYVPLVWGKNQAGMQAFEEFTGEDRETLIARWNYDCRYALDSAREYAKFKEVGVHKQIINRILEPFSHITVVCSGTEWSNFLGLRDHEAAEPHIQILAREIRKCLENDPIQDLKPGQWHLPFIDDKAKEEAWDRAIAGTDHTSNPHTNDALYERYILKLSVARCASTSYKTVEGSDMTLEKAIEIHDKLVGSTPLHASPAEHVAYADQFIYEQKYIISGTDREETLLIWERKKLHGNFEGFCQYRKTLPNENL
jgi:thymidylate synthase ThyX